MVRRDQGKRRNQEFQTKMHIRTLGVLTQRSVIVPRSAERVISWLRRPSARLVADPLGSAAGSLDRPINPIDAVVWNLRDNPSQRVVDET
jgi:hypothetical protein